MIECSQTQPVEGRLEQPDREDLELIHLCESNALVLVANLDDPAKYLGMCH